MIKLVAFDLDDTLLDNAGAVSSRSQAAIRAAMEQGVAVTIATGRMYRSVRPYALDLELDIPLIAYNGALIKCSRSEETLFHCPLDAETASAVMAFFRERGWYIQAYIDDVLYVKEREEKARCYEELSGVTAVPLGEALYSLPGLPTKLFAITGPEDMDEVYTAVKTVFGNRLHAAISKPNYLELVDPGVNKGAALSFLAQRLGISRSEVMAVGDSQNDLDMIRYAGWGVAMGNALDVVKAAANAVTGCNDADGVAEAIEKYVLQAGGRR